MSPIVKHWPVILFNLLYIIPFTIYFFQTQNYEFILYLGVLLFFFGLTLATIAKSKLPPLLLWGLSFWGCLHVCGGAIKIDGSSLYSLVLFPLITIDDVTIFRYDHAVHFYGFGVATLLGYHIINFYLHERVNNKALYPLLVCIGMGLGAFNEVIEFLAVVMVPETGVGGYTNTALDLVFNFLGAIAAVFLLHCGKILPKQT